MRDFLRGFRTLHFVGPCVTVFGSARIKPGDPHYELTRKMGAAIARLGFTVITGGGPGIMEAANRGAKEAGGRSVGCTIELASEQPTNVYLDRCVRMHYFFARKTLLVKYSYAFVVMPGGAGTLDEFFEALTLIQTGKIKNFPIVIMGTDYWKELLHFIETMAQRGMIAARDLSLIYATDSVDEAVAHIQSKAIEPFGLKSRKRATRRHVPWLGERGLSHQMLDLSTELLYRAPRPVARVYNCGVSPPSLGVSISNVFGFFEAFGNFALPFSKNNNKGRSFSLKTELTIAAASHRFCSWRGGRNRQSNRDYGPD